MPLRPFFVQCCPLGLSLTLAVAMGACGQGAKKGVGQAGERAEQVAEEGGDTATPSPLSATTRLGQSVVTKLLAGQCSELWQLFSDEMRGVVGDEASFTPGCKSLSDLLKDSEKISEEEKSGSYIARFKNAKAGVLRITVSGSSISGKDKIDGMLIAPDEPAKPAESKYTEYQTKTELRLPFDGDWTVVWGGRSVEQNYHVAHASQHFAYDIVVTKDGRSHQNEGKDNADYYCFGKPILAAGAGQVVEVRTGVKDNIPGQMNSQKPTGNHVIIDHGNGEFSLYAHLQDGSTLVAEGEKVASGQAIGRCGNSGNSSEAHLHFQLQDQPEFGKGESMPAQFQNYIANDKAVKRGEPVQGQMIRPAK